MLGILFKRINGQGAIATLFFGLAAATVRIIAELMYLDDTGKLMEGVSGPFVTYASINFAHMAIYMFLACVIICFVVSYLTAKPSEAQITGLTFGTLTAEQKASAKESYNTWDLVASGVLVAVVISILVYFTG